jgi:class 3 adenylate cyclase
MKASFSEYDHVQSASRVDEILDSSDNNYEELDDIPSRDRLTFTNGFYVNCTAVFIDLRGSSDLPNKHKRTRLARIYRSYISEAVAVLNGNSCVSEVNINGDCIWGVFSTPKKRDIDSVFGTCARLNSLMKMIRCRLAKRKIDPIYAGIGMDYGRALMIKAGHKGSSINDVVWMGDVVNRASNLCGKAGRSDTQPILVSDVIENNLNDHNKKLVSRHYGHQCYQADIINTAMEEWHEKNCT